MTNEEIAVKLAEYGKEIGSLKHRATDLEEQKDQGSRLDTLEREPAERWNSAKRTAFTTVVSVVAGALATGLLIMVGQYL